MVFSDSTMNFTSDSMLNSKVIFSPNWSLFAVQVTNVREELPIRGFAGDIVLVAEKSNDFKEYGMEKIPNTETNTHLNPKNKGMKKCTLQVSFALKKDALQLSPALKEDTLQLSSLISIHN